MGVGADSTTVYALVDDNAVSMAGAAANDSINRMSQLPRGLKNYYQVVKS